MRSKVIIGKISLLLPEYLAHEAQLSFLMVDKQGHSPYLTLTHPARRNALTAQLRGELISGLEQAIADPGVRVIIVNGAGGTFCSGGDLAAMPPAAPCRLRPATCWRPPSCRRFPWAGVVDEPSYVQVSALENMTEAARCAGPPWAEVPPGLM